MCPCSSHGREKLLPQSGHLHGSVWVRMCIFRADEELYSLLQNLQLKSLWMWFDPCSCWCLAKPDCVEKYLLHWLQWKLLSLAPSSVFSQVKMEWWKRGGETGGEEGRGGWCQELVFQ